MFGGFKGLGLQGVGLGFKALAASARIQDVSFVFEGQSCVRDMYRELFIYLCVCV